MKLKLGLVIMLSLISVISEASQKFECQAKYSYNSSMTGIYVAHVLLGSPTSGQLAAWDICLAQNCNGKKSVIAQGNISLQNQASRGHAGYVIYNGADQNYPFWIELPRAVIGNNYSGVFKGYLRYDINDGPGVIPYDLNCRQLL
jgi:hypothetical protein